MTTDKPIVLDQRRGSAEQIATEIRRRHAEVEADQDAVRRRRAEFEIFLASAPAPTWREAAEKARYLITLLAGAPAGRDPRRQELIAAVLEDFKRLSAAPDAPAPAGEAPENT
jgi:hypothetical protein